MKAITLITAVVALLAAVTLSSCTTTEAASTRGGVEPYQFDTCIVTDNELGSMGDPVTLIHEGREVKFCCQPCVRKFTNNPDKYLARLDRWIDEAGQ